MNEGTIIMLNGTSSSGKSSIVRALQEIISSPYMDAGIDRFICMLPERYHRRPEWDEVLGLAFASGPLGHHVVSAMHCAILSIAKAGHNVVADHVLVEERWLNECASLFCEMRAFLIGVHCPLDLLEQRERLRKDRTLGRARAQFNVIHAANRYDLNVDTATSTPIECAIQIVARINSSVPPTAFRFLAQEQSAVAKARTG